MRIIWFMLALVACGDDGNGTKPPDDARPVDTPVVVDAPDIDAPISPDAPPDAGSTSCVLDQSTLDNCTL